MRGRETRPRSVHILQVNVGRSGQAHDIALSLGNQQRAHVIAIQEPWVFPDLGRKTTKRHPNYEVFAPTDNWQQRPRVLLLVRKNIGFKTEQPMTDISPDIVMATITAEHQATNIINIYNAPHGSRGAGDSIAHLTAMTIQSPTVVVGDFNIRHRSWDTTGGSPQLGESLEGWMQDNDLKVCNPLGTPTHNRGGVLDLVLSNIADTQTSVRADLETTSDHSTLWSSFPCVDNLVAPMGRLRVKDIDCEKFQSLLKHAAETTSEDIEQEADDLVRAIVTAMEGATSRTRPGSHGKLWWNDECQAAHRLYLQARRTGPAEDERRFLRRATRNAKRAFWRGQVEQAADMPDVYKILRWAKASPPFRSPVMISPSGQPAITTLDKADLLRSSLLNRQAEAEDIPFETPTVPRRDIQWGIITAEETFNTTCRTTSTTPGVDEIPASVLRLAWPVIGSRVTSLFQECVRSGRHPQTFKKAEIIILPKSGPRNRTLPKSYRPIALLSCLGKGLERLIARRVSYLCQTHSVLAPDQCSAIAKRSAVDLTTALTCDIESEWEKGRVAGMVTVDVQGAFDGVLHNRLLHRLREQGWPGNMIQWTKSFLTDRRGQVRFEGQRTDDFAIECGLPQGSPVSPILFLLYIEPMLHLSEGRFGFADDGAILASGRHLHDCKIALGRQLRLTLDWGRENGVNFDLEKSDLQYFHRKIKFVEEPLVVDGHRLEPNANTRWLGVHFDRKLSFREHISLATMRAKKVTDHVRQLCGPSYGADPSLLRHAVQSTAFASLLYGAETWFSPKTPQHLIAKLQVAMNHAARAVLPVYRTTPEAALMRETGWPPALAWLNRIRDRLALRISQVDERHPLRRRAHCSRMQWLRQHLNVATTVWQPKPPWSNTDRQTIRNAIGAVGKERGRQTFIEWLENVSHDDLVVYSDGSMTESGQTGAGFCVFRGREEELLRGRVPLGQSAEVFDAELAGALAGAIAATQHPFARHARCLTICLDNEEAAIELMTGAPTTSGHGAVYAFQRAKDDWLRLQSRTHGTMPRPLTTRWCPGHQDIRGNDVADQMAKQAHQEPYNTHILTAARARRVIRERFDESLKTHWEANQPERYRHLNLTATTAKPPPELKLRRKALGRLLAARSGHGDFAAYHQRFRHEDALLTCSCSAEKSTTHFLECQNAAFPPPRSVDTYRTDEQWLLGSSQGAQAFAKWCADSAFFEITCFHKVAILPRD